MRQIYNVESPPSSMLYDTTSLCGESVLISTEALQYDGIIPHRTTTVSSNYSSFSTSHPESSLICPQYQRQLHANTTSPSSASSLLLPANDNLPQAKRTSPKKSGPTGGSPSRLSLANLIPSRSALIFATTKFLFSHLLYLSISKAFA